MQGVQKLIKKLADYFYYYANNKFKVKHSRILISHVTDFCITNCQIKKRGL